MMKIFPSIIILFLSFVLAFEVYPHSTVDLFHAVKKRDNDRVRKWTKSGTVFHQDTCSMEVYDRISTVSYYQLRCGLDRIGNFIHFAKGKTIQSTNSWKLSGIQKIGKKEFIELDFVQSTESKNYFPIDISNTGYSRRKDKSKVVEKDPYKNQNLEIYLEYLKLPENKQNLTVGMDIFFDKTCPIQYISSNHDFYWDNIIMHEFEVTCADKLSHNYIIRIQANNLGELPINNQLISNIQPGKKFIAQLSISDWQGDKIRWDNPRLYEYE